MAASAKLQAWISLETSKFRKGISKIRKGVGRIAKAGSIAFAAMTTAILGAAAAAFKLTSQVAKVGDDIQKMSIRTGIAAEELSKYRFIANQTGTSMADLEKGAANMAKVMDGARDGMKENSDTLAKLGLSLDDLEGKTPMEAFELFGQRVNAIDDPLQKTAAAMEIFGKSGKKLIPLISESAVSIQKMKIEAEELGLVFDKDAADGAAKFTDSVAKMKFGLEGIKTEAVMLFINEFGGGIDNITKKIKELIASGRITEWIIGAAKTVNGAVKDMRAVFVGLKTGLNIVFDGIALAGEAVFKTLAGSLATLVGAQLFVVEKGINLAIKGINLLRKEANQLSKVDIGADAMLKAGEILFEGAFAASDKLFTGAFIDENARKGGAELNKISAQHDKIDAKLDKMAEKDRKRRAANLKRLNKEKEKLKELEKAGKDKPPAKGGPVKPPPEEKRLLRPESAQFNALERIGLFIGVNKSRVSRGEEQIVNRLDMILSQLVIANRQKNKARFS